MMQATFWFLDPVTFNTGASAGILLVTAIFSWRYAIDTDAPHFVEDAHIAWCLYWATSLVILTVPQMFWALKIALIDAQSFCAVAFFFIVLHGKEYHPGPLLKRLVVFMLVWFTMRAIPLMNTSWNRPAEDFLRLLNTIPSQALSGTGLIMLGSILALRYGEAAMIVVVVAALYAILQQLIYYAEFIQVRPPPTWLFWLLGVWKYMFASIFYWFFLTPLKNYDRKRLPSPSLPEDVVLTPRLRNIPAVAWGVLGAATGHFFGAFLAGLLH